MKHGRCGWLLVNLALACRWVPAFGSAPGHVGGDTGFLDMPRGWHVGSVRGGIRLGSSACALSFSVTPSPIARVMVAKTAV
eukprot:5616273-Pyramimonas_sp.AAC.1